MPSLYLPSRRATPSLRADEILWNELLVSISSPSSRLPSQSSFCLCALLVLSAAPLPPPGRNRIFHSPISLSSFRILESVHQETRTMFAWDRLFKSRFVPGIRLEIARNFVEAISSGLSRLQRLVRPLTMLRNRSTNLSHDPLSFIVVLLQIRR